VEQLLLFLWFFGTGVDGVAAGTACGNVKPAKERRIGSLIILEACREKFTSTVIELCMQEAWWYIISRLARAVSNALPPRYSRNLLSHKSVSKIAVGAYEGD